VLQEQLGQCAIVVEHVLQCFGTFQLHEVVAQVDFFTSNKPKK
jgi:hypothetical protein